MNFIPNIYQIIIYYQLFLFLFCRNEFQIISFLIGHLGQRNPQNVKTILHMQTYVLINKPSFLLCQELHKFFVFFFVCTTVFNRVIFFIKASSKFYFGVFQQMQPRQQLNERTRKKSSTVTKISAVVVICIHYNQIII